MPPGLLAIGNMESIVDERGRRLVAEKVVRVADARRDRGTGAATSVGFHLLLATLALWPLRGALETTSLVAPSERDPTVFFVDALPPDPPALPGLNPAEPGQDGAAIRPPGESTSVTIRGFTFDFSKVGQRTAFLFPFLTPGLSIDRFVPPPKPPDAHVRVPAEFIHAGKPPVEAIKPPLVLTDSAFETLIDKSWSRRDRWGKFQAVARLTDAYDPDSGRLPEVLRAYAERNGLQPYADPGIRDPRLWTELQIAADHVEFIGLISQYVSEHPSTRAAIELLFMLDKLAQASRDALITLLDTEPYGDLTLTRQANLDALTFIVQLRHHFNDVLAAKGLSARELLGLYYDNVRIKILNAILSTSPDGYRASDAHFLMGGIYWRQGRKVEAVQSWRHVSIRPDSAYGESNADIVAEMRAADNRPGISEREIERILTADYGRWITSSLDRLRKFGYRIDGY